MLELFIAFFGIWHGGWALLGIMLLLFASQSIALGAIAYLLKRLWRKISEKL